MKMTITDRSGVLSKELRDFVERRLHFALSRFSSKIQSAVVVLNDENGPRGGVDKVCRITIRMRGSRDVIITDRAAENEACVATAAERAGRAVARSVDRSQSFERSGSLGLASAFATGEQEDLATS